MRSAPLHQRSRSQVHVGDAAETPARATGSMTAAVLAAGLALGATLAVDLLKPARRATLIGAEADRQQKARASESWRDGSRARGVEERIKLRSRTRWYLAPYWSALMMHPLGSVPSDVVLGEGGWLFLRSRVQPQGKSRDVGPRALSAGAAAIQRRLAQLGARLIMLPVPRKAAACAEKLPPAMDPDADYDASLFEALDERGVELLDVGAVLSELEPHERYLRQDTHWAYPAVRGIAREIAARYPELAAKDLEIRLQEHTIHAGAGLLDIAAIGQSHPAGRWVGGDLSIRPVVEPAAARKALSAGPRDVDVAVVGSSFTKNYMLAEAVAAELETLVYPGGVAGRPFAGSMGTFAKRFRGRPFPETVLYEMPVHQAFQVGRRSPAAAVTLGSFFVATSEAALAQGPSAIPASALAPPRVGAAGSQGFQLQFPPGTLLSTGDGVLQLRLRLRAQSLVQWQLSGSETRQIWDQPPGDQELLIPVLHSRTGAFPVTLSALGADGVETSVEYEVMVDAQLEAARSIALEAVGSEDLQSPEAPLSVGRHDVLLITWSGSPKTVGVVLRGTTPEGQDRRIRARFPKPRSKLAVFSLTPLRGGTLDSVRVLGDADEVQVSVAPPASAPR